MEPVHKYFQFALKYQLEQQGRGTQNQLAVKLGFHPSYIMQIKNGNRVGTPETQARIAAALGYSYEEFLYLGRSIYNETKDKLSKSDAQRIHQSISHPIGYSLDNDDLWKKISVILEKLPDDKEAFEAFKFQINAFYELISKKPKKGKTSKNAVAGKDAA